MNRCHFVLGMGAASCVAVSAAGAPPSFRDAVTAANPILWYRFDETSGNVVNHGSLGLGWDAVSHGPIVRGVESPGGDTGMGLGMGVSLESLGNSPLTGNPTFSIETVVRLASPGAASLWGPFLQWGDGMSSPSGRTGHEVFFGIQNGNNLRIYAGFYNAGVRTVDLVPGNQWLHVVWTRAGGNDTETGSTLYVNGEPAAIQRDTDLSPGFVAASGIEVNGVPFLINAAHDFIGQRYFTGALDELALYDRVLTPGEIAQRARLVTCAADFNADGAVNSQDFFDFLTAFFASAPNADFNFDGAVNSQDFFDFLTAFFAGC